MIIKDNFCETANWRESTSQVVVSNQNADTVKQWNPKKYIFTDRSTRKPIILLDTVIQYRFWEDRNSGSMAITGFR